MSVPFGVRIARTATVLRRTFIGASAAWAAALPGSTFAGTRPHVSPLVALIAGAVYAMGSIVCHQLPERSFHLWGAQLPVCARCTGIYVGAAIGSLLYAVSTVRVSAFRRAATRVLVLGALPTVATLAYEWTTGVTPSNTIRAVAGFPLGAAVALIVLAAADNQVN